MRLTIVSAKSKIYSKTRLFITRQFHRFGNRSCFINFQIIADFGAQWLKFKHASNKPVYFHDLCTRCGPICHEGLSLGPHSAVGVTEQKGMWRKINWQSKRAKEERGRRLKTCLSCHQSMIPDLGIMI